MAHSAAGDLDELVALAGACNVAHAPDANDIAALQAQLANSLYHLSATRHPAMPQDAFAPSNTPTSSSVMTMHGQAPWSSIVVESHGHGWPSTPSASASASTSPSSRGTLFEDNEEEMMLDSPIPNGPDPSAFSMYSALPVRANSMSGGAGGGGRPCTPVLPVLTAPTMVTTTMVTTATMANTSLVHPRSISHPPFHYPTPNGSFLDTAHDLTTHHFTTDSFATSDPFYIDLQQQQKTQQRSRTLQAMPLSLQASYSVQYAPLLRQNHVQGDAPNPPSSILEPLALRPRY